MNVLTRLPSFFKQLIIKKFHFKSRNLFFFRIFSVRLQWEKAEEEEVTQVHFVLFSYKDLDKIEASTDTTIMHDFCEAVNNVLSASKA